MAVEAAGRVLVRLDRWLERAETALLISLLLALIGVGTTQILLRNLAASGLGGADPAMRVAVLWIGLLGAMAASRQQRHVTIDLLSRHLPGAARRWSAVLINAFTATVTGLIAWHAGRLVWFEFGAPSTAFAGLPVWLAQAMIPAGFGLISLRYGLRALRGCAPAGPE